MAHRGGVEVFETVLICLSVAAFGYVAWSAMSVRAVASGYDVPPARARSRSGDSMFSLSMSVLPAPEPVELPETRRAGPARAPAPRRPSPPVHRLELEIGQDEDGHHEFEIIELREGDDVLSLEFTEDTSSHLHLVHGRATADVDGKAMKTAWLDVYLSRAKTLSHQDLDESGEYPPERATHVLRVDLGCIRTTADGLTAGEINDAPDLIFDRKVETETHFRA